jgi:DNA-binding MarR family transcriptional regulator
MESKAAEKKITNEVLISIRKIIQMVDLHSRYLVKEVGLTGPQLTILNEVSRQGDMSTGELARAISLSQATVTGILERLEKKQLIIRERCDRDRRKIIISVTHKCTELLSQAPPPLQESFVSSFHELENWEQLMILSSLQRLVALMDAKKIDAAPMLTTGPIDASQSKA